MFRCCAPTRGTTQDAGKFPLTSDIYHVDNLERRDGLGHSSSQNPSPALASYTNLATALVNPANYPRSQPSSPSSISPVFTPSTSPTVSVTKPVPLLSVVLSSCVCDGSLQRGKDQVQCSLSGCSTSFTNSKRKARSACTTHTPPSSLSRTLLA